MSLFLEEIKNKRLYFDGGTGATLVSRGVLGAGMAPECLNIDRPEEILALHREYLLAGADIIKTNSFGINSGKYSNYRELLSSSVSLAKQAVAECGGGFVALDIGPSGRMLSPLGDLDFEDAVSLFADTVRASSGLGCDLILIETVSDLYEAKAAVLAAKENSELPVVVTLSFGSDGKLMSGADVGAVVATLEGLGVAALGINCSSGPREMLDTVRELLEYASVPVVVNPNAGLPRYENGRTVYDLGAEEFAPLMRELAEMGASVLGGCCGTTPEYIKELKKVTKDVPFLERKRKKKTLISSFTHSLSIGDRPLLIGERLNPTGKAKVKAALREGRLSYLAEEALAQEDAGADILDINTGLADIDEAKMMLSVVELIQSVSSLPLQIDSGRAEVLEGAMRRYCGKPLVNSVNGSAESLDSILPLVNKYGGVLIALTMDEEGIPETVEGRVAIAERIIRRAEEYGIDRRELVFDPLALTVASGDKNALVTLETVKRLNGMGLYTSLGVSNVSFGLPARATLNSAFLTAALFGGLDLAIINPSSPEMMNAYLSYLALSGRDEGCAAYIGGVREVGAVSTVSQKGETVCEKMSLEEAIVRGIKDASASECRLLLGKEAGLDIINQRIIPALDRVGEDFEKKKIYLPMLLRSAEAAAAAFGVVRDSLPEGEGTNPERSILLATVKGDIHDIGKNIVRLVFESYGFSVIDLGRDVPPQKIVEEAVRTKVRFVGLSALMTTTLPAMSETVALLKRSLPGVKVLVGGAVLTEEYATKIGADSYAPDAMAGVRFALGELDGSEA